MATALALARDVLAGDTRGAAGAAADGGTAQRLLAMMSRRVEERLRTQCGDDTSARACPEAVDAFAALKTAEAAVLQAHHAQRGARISTVPDTLNRLQALESVANVADRVPEHVCQLGFDRAILSRVHGSSWVPEAVYVRDDPESAEEILEAGRQEPQLLTHAIIETEMVRRRGPLLVTDVQGSSKVHQRIALASSSRSYVAAPVLSAGRVIGFIHADRYLQGRHVDDSDRDVLWLFAQGLAWIFERAVVSQRLRMLRAQINNLGHGITDDMGCLDDTDLRLVEHEGEPPAGPRETARSFHALSPPMHPELTRREVDVLRLMADGETNAGIAQRLVISQGTVKSHVKHILRKLAAANRAEAVSIYFRLEQQRRAASEGVAV